MFYFWLFEGQSVLSFGCKTKFGISEDQWFNINEKDCIWRNQNAMSQKITKTIVIEIEHVEQLQKKYTGSSDCSSNFQIIC